MNGNLFRSILNVLTGGTLVMIFTTLTKLAGDNPATPDVVEVTATWIPIEYQAAVGIGFVILGFLIKAFGGSGATPIQNLAAPVVPVVPEAKVGVGTVTPAQVAEP